MDNTQDSDSSSHQYGYLTTDSCPCCGTHVEDAKRSVSSTPSAEAIAPDEHGRFYSGYTPQRVFFTYFKCGKCGAYYCPTFYNPEQLGQLYSWQEENNVEASFLARELTHKGYAQTLRGYSRMAGGFLELGADIGLFARICSRDSQFHHFWLYEPNKNVHDQLTTNMEGKSVTIRDIDFTATDIPAGSISTAVMIHVCDHLVKPLDVLKNIHKNLEDGGILFLVTHNVESLLAKVLGWRWPCYLLQHPLLFSPRSMTALLKRAGFEVLLIDSSTNYFPLSFLARATMTMLGLPSGWIPNWDKPLLGLKLGNMAVIARKTAT